jgi:hypothetical protein
LRVRWAPEISFGFGRWRKKKKPAANKANKTWARANQMGPNTGSRQIKSNQIGSRKKKRQIKSNPGPGKSNGTKYEHEHIQIKSNRACPFGCSPSRVLKKLNMFFFDSPIIFAQETIRRKRVSKTQNNVPRGWVPSG